MTVRAPASCRWRSRSSTARGRRCRRTAARRSRRAGTRRALNGTYQVRAIATDLVGNPSLADTASNITVDNTAPTVTLGGIATNAKVRGTVPLTAVRERRFRLGCGFRAVRDLRRHVDGALDGQQRDPFTASWNTTGSTGRIRCAPSRPTLAGNPSLADTATNITVDNTVPTVTLGGLATNAKVRATVPLTASVRRRHGLGRASRSRSSASTGRRGSISTDNSAPFTRELEHDRAERHLPGARDRHRRRRQRLVGATRSSTSRSTTRFRPPRWRPRRTSRRSRQRRRSRSPRRRIRRSTVPRPASTTTTSIAPTPAT